MIEWVKDIIALCVKASELEDKACVDKFALLLERYCNFNEEEKVRVRKILMDNFEPKDLVYIYSWFCSYMKMSDFGRDMIDCMIRGDYETDVSLMLEMQARFYAGYEENLLRTLHNKNVQLLKEKINTNLSYRTVSSRDKKKIVIMTEQIRGINHAPTKIVLETIKILQRDLGYEVILFACPSDKVLPLNIWGSKTMQTQTIETAPDMKMFQLEYEDTTIKCCMRKNSTKILSKKQKLMYATVCLWL